MQEGKDSFFLGSDLPLSAYTALTKIKNLLINSLRLLPDSYSKSLCIFLSAYSPILFSSNIEIINPEQKIILYKNEIQKHKMAFQLNPNLPGIATSQSSYFLRSSNLRDFCLFSRNSINRWPFTSEISFAKFTSSASSSNFDLCTSYTYKGPTDPGSNNKQLVLVQILIRDSSQPGGVQIQSVDFNNQIIPLQPRDIYGNRGTASFQVPPGNYKLRWTVQTNKTVWPRVINHEEEVNIDPRDLWLQIQIIGDEASIR